MMKTNNSRKIALSDHKGQLEALGIIPINVPFDAYIEARERTIAYAVDLPPYLLLPEVEQLIEATLDDRHRFAFELMWYTGARVTEALKLRAKDLITNDVLTSSVSLENTKRKANAKTTRRTVPINDPYFINRIQRYIKTHSIKKLEPVLPYTRKAVYDEIKKNATALGLSIDVTPHTLRHSFAINHLLHGQPIHEIKGWLGHTSIKLTEVYLQVLSADTSHLSARTRFRSVL